MEIHERIQQLAGQYFEQVVQIRRHLHQYPELSYQEYETAAYLEGELEKMGLKSQRLADTGLTGWLRNPQQGQRTIALRAEMDALPIEEKTGLAYASRYPGRMHACGHDAHAAMLLGALKILQSLDLPANGNIQYIFQPAEEKLPGGALKMIEAGVLEDPKPELIIGQHVYPDLPSGSIGYKPGAYMASTDEIYLTIKGKGGHAALPHECDDTVYLASQIIQSLQQIAARKAPPMIPTVLSFGKINAPGATNVIPGEVYLEGTFRTMDEQWREKAHQLIRQICESILQPTQTHCELHIKKGYPVLINDPQTTQKAMDYSSQLLGKENIEPLAIRMTAEDFAYYTQNIPGIFYRLGVANSSHKITPSLHSDTFNIDEQALQTGMANLAWLGYSFLQRRNGPQPGRG